LQLLVRQFISVHSETLKFNKTAEVIAEVEPFARCARGQFRHVNSEAI
jgi:hypothetical protein